MPTALQSSTGVPLAGSVPITKHQAGEGAGRSAFANANPGPEASCGLSPGSRVPGKTFLIDRIADAYAEPRP